jgi:hypothetical protein
MGEERTCIDCGGHGPTVEPRWPGYGHKMFMRCKSCGEARLEREQGNIARNFQSGPICNRGNTELVPDYTGPFDPMDAGESFEEESY